jgi:hypothetical protein
MIRRFLAPSSDKIGISAIKRAMGTDILNTHKTKEKANKMSRQNIEIKPQRGPRMTPILGTSYLTSLLTSFYIEIQYYLPDFVVDLDETLALSID